MYQKVSIFFYILDQENASCISSLQVCTLSVKCHCWRPLWAIHTTISTRRIRERVSNNFPCIVLLQTVSNSDVVQWFAVFVDDTKFEVYLLVRLVKVSTEWTVFFIHPFSEINQRGCLLSEENLLDVLDDPPVKWIFLLIISETEVLVCRLLIKLKTYVSTYFYISWSFLLKVRKWITR